MHVFVYGFSNDTVSSWDYIGLYSFIYSFIHLFIYSCIHSFMASLTHFQHLRLLFIYDLFNTM